MPAQRRADTEAPLRRMQIEAAFFRSLVDELERYQAAGQHVVALYEQLREQQLRLDQLANADSAL